MLANMLNTGFSRSAIHAAARGPLAEAVNHYTPMDVILSLLAKAPPREVGLLNSMRYLDLKLTLAGDILVKVDRASMAVALEVRPVYLHQEVVALAERIPPRLLADKNQSKKVLKSAFRPWLPDTILYRKKQGLAMPLKRWINGDLRQMFAQQEGDSPLEGLLDETQLLKLAREDAFNGADPTSLAHNLFFLRQWIARWS